VTDGVGRNAIAAAAALRLATPLLDRRPVLVVSDFDGTLSQIVQDPWAAEMVPLARRALRVLRSVPDVHVVMLSGRTALDLAGRARVGGVTYVGNHGVERGQMRRRGRATAMRIAAQPADAAHAELAEALAEAIPRLVPEPWLVVERKGPSVAFHWRQAPPEEVSSAAERVRAAADSIDPTGVLVRTPGRRVLELRPPGAAEKGDAMRVLLEESRPGVAFVLGDDRSDALAFDVLREARADGRTTGLAVAVQAHREAPIAVAEAADIVLPSPREAARFLAGLARHLSRAAGSAAPTVEEVRDR
jgi:trehalose-phosphatase